MIQSLKKKWSFLFLVFLVLSCSTESTPDFTLTTSSEPADGGTVTQTNLVAPKGESITISATPNEHWVFAGWSGDLTGTNQSTMNVFMDRDRTVTALFEKVEYPVTVNIEGEGEVRQEIVSQRSITTDYPHATILRLTTEPLNGWKFKEWQGGATGVDTELELEVISPIEVTAIFERIDYKISISVEGKGDVLQEIIQSKVIESEYPFETIVQLTAVPDEGWEFVEWSGAISGPETVQVLEVSGDKVVLAKFKRIDYSLSLNIDGEGTVEVYVDGQKTSDMIFPFETEVELVAIPDESWEFVSWSGDVGGNNPNSTFIIDSDKSISAIFSLKTYNVTVQISGGGSVLQNGSQILTNSYSHGSTVKLDAIASPGWAFSGWSGYVQSDFTPLYINVQNDVVLNLQFLQLPSRLRILPLGDSITNGFPFSYRYSLFNMLTNSGHNFNFVGTQNSNPANYPGAWDTRHEGHNGASSRGVDVDLNSWLQTYQADIAIVHLGTNDVSYSINNPSDFTLTLDYMESIINKLRSDNPIIRIYLAKIIPPGSGLTPSDQFFNLTNEWNTGIQNLADQKNTSVSPVVVVDMNTGFGDSDLIDEVHPSEAAAEKIAQRWFNALTGN